MKTLRKTLLAIALLSFTISATAQNKFRLSDLYLSSGADFTNAGRLNTWETNNLERDLINKSGLDLKQRQAFRGNMRTNAYLGIMAGWTLRGSRLGQQKIRLGLSAGAYSLNWNSAYSNNTDYRVDTLVSQQTGEQYYIDSTHTQSLYFNQQAQMVNLTADYLVYFNPRNKLTFYAGAGARMGISLDNSVEANYYEYSSTNDILNNNYPKFNWEDNNNYSERFKSLSPTFNMRANAILGLNYRLSKRNRFLKHTHLFAEFNLGAQFNTMEQIETSIGLNTGFQSGLRIDFNKRKTAKKRTVRQRTKRRRY